MTDVIQERVAGPPPLEAHARTALMEGRHGDPHQVLGPHAATVNGESGVVIRVMQPDAADAFVIRDGIASAMRAEGDGFFSVFLRGPAVPFRYSFRFIAPDGTVLDHSDVSCEA